MFYNEKWLEELLSFNEAKVLNEYGLPLMKTISKLKEEDGQVNIELDAPGYNKSDFHVSLSENDRVLFVVASSTLDGPKRSLNQSFQIKPVDHSTIKAIYNAGVLKITALYKTKTEKSSKIVKVE